jgi:hypothetical protein
MGLGWNYGSESIYMGTSPADWIWDWETNGSTFYSFSIYMGGKTLGGWLIIGLWTISIGFLLVYWTTGCVTTFVGSEETVIIGLLLFVFADSFFLFDKVLDSVWTSSFF